MYLFNLSELELLQLCQTRAMQTALGMPLGMESPRAWLENQREAKIPDTDTWSDTILATETNDGAEREKSMADPGVSSKERERALIIQELLGEGKPPYQIYEHKPFAFLTQMFDGLAPDFARWYDIGNNEIVLVLANGKSYLIFADDDHVCWETLRACDFRRILLRVWEKPGDMDTLKRARELLCSWMDAAMLAVENEVRQRLPQAVAISEHGDLWLAEQVAIVWPESGVVSIEPGEKFHENKIAVPFNQPHSALSEQVWKCYEGTRSEPLKKQILHYFRRFPKARGTHEVPDKFTVQVIDSEATKPPKTVFVVEARPSDVVPSF